jgi:hypothetical protein
MMMHSFCPTSEKTIAHLQIIEDCTGAPDEHARQSNRAEVQRRCANTMPPIKVFRLRLWRAGPFRVVWLDGLNACIECCDRWASDGRVALEWIGKDFARQTLPSASCKRPLGQALQAALAWPLLERLPESNHISQSLPANVPVRSDLGIAAS